MRYFKLLMLGFTFLMLTSAAPAKKHTRHKCPPPCHRCAEPAKATKADGGIWGQVCESLELTGGWRWDHGSVLACVPRETPRTVDPLYLGIGVRPKLANRTYLSLGWNRDIWDEDGFIEQSQWNAHAALVVTPFAKR